MKAKIIQETLERMADPVRAQSSLRFFRDVGDDIFIGITSAQAKTLVKDELKALGSKPLPLDEVEKLLTSNVHEHRSVALALLVAAFGKRPAEQASIVEFYLGHTKWVNNWDLVDISASIAGMWLADKDRTPLYTLAQSSNMWEQRIAVVATLVFIRKGEFADTLNLCEILMEHPHYLMPKATGWMLREVGKKDPEVLRGFLGKHALHMNRTMLSYCLERFSPEEKAFWRAQKICAK